MGKQWNELAYKAKTLAKKIITGDKTNKKGERLTYVVDRLDIFASNALNRKYSNVGSIASIHTYPGGNQVVATMHPDGSKGMFKGTI